MCMQCEADMVPIYSEVKNDVNIYIGIATDSTVFDLGPGDVMIGTINDPFFVIPWDLDDEGYNNYLGARTTIEFDGMSSIDWIYYGVLTVDKHFGGYSKESGANFTRWLWSHVVNIFEEQDIPLDKDSRLKWATDNKERIEFEEIQRTISEMDEGERQMWLVDLTNREENEGELDGFNKVALELLRS